MFGNKKVEDHEILDTIIGEKTTLTGKIESKANIRIDGNVIGDLLIDGDVTIGYTGKISGNIACQNLIIAGHLEGNVLAKEQLRIASSGKLIGDIEVRSFVVDEDAIFKGKSNMNEKKTLKLENSKDKDKDLSTSSEKNIKFN